MEKVTLKSAVSWRNTVYKAGQTVEVPDEDAKKWRAKGLLHEGKGPTEQRVKQRQVERALARGAGAGFGMPEEDEAPARQMAFLPVTPKQYDNLKAAGIDTPDALEAASDEELTEAGLDAGEIRRLRELMGGGNGGEGASVSAESAVPAESAARSSVRPSQSTQRR